jgi:hypothetical protein
VQWGVLRQSKSMVEGERGMLCRVVQLCVNADLQVNKGAKWDIIV